MPFAGSVLPTGYLFCDGSTKSRTGSTAALFAAIGTTFGDGSGNGQDFSLPNLQGVFPLGASSFSQSTATPYPLGQDGVVNKTGYVGEASHTLSVAELPAHTHGYQVAQDLGPPTGGVGSNYFSKQNGSATTDTGNGGGGAHNNMPPYIVLNYIIKL
jgi:microcystin-dependent protein